MGAYEVITVGNVRLVLDCSANIVVTDGPSDGDQFWSCTYRKGKVIHGCLRSIYDVNFSANIRQKGIMRVNYNVLPKPHGPTGWH